MAIEATRMAYPLVPIGSRTWVYRCTRAGVALIVPAAEEGIIRADEAAIVHAADELACAAEIAAVQAEDAAALAAAVAAAQAADAAACAAEIAAVQAEDAAALAAAVAAAQAADAAACAAEALTRAARVTSAEATSSTTVRVYFDRVMQDDAALRDPASYVLSAREGSIARTVVAVEVARAAVDLTLSGEMTLGPAAYMVDVAATLRDGNGDLIHADPVERTATFDGLGELPGLTRAASTASDVERVRVTFSETMAEDADLIDPANYTITGDSAVTVLEVVVVSPTEVDLLVTGQVPGGRYSLTTANMRDTAGNQVS